MFISDMQVKNKKYMPRPGNFYGYIMTNEPINTNTLSPEERKTMTSIVTTTKVPDDDDTDTADSAEEDAANALAEQDRIDNRFAKQNSIWTQTKKNRWNNSSSHQKT